MSAGFFDYQVRADETAFPFKDAVAAIVAETRETSDLTHAERGRERVASLLELLYATTGLAGEAGEFANKVKKVIRDHGGVVDEQVRKELAKELGGILWYWSTCCTVLGLRTQDVAHMNLEQLRSRKERGVLQGSGDDR